MISRSNFLLNQDLTFLNHGSFGACPIEIFEDYQNWQRQLEYDPVQFITQKGPKLMKESREALARFINAEANDLVFVPNPTFAVNILRDSLHLQPGDEILTTDLEYGAMDRTWKHYCLENKTTYVRQKINLPIQSKEAFLEDFWKGYSNKTKVVFISEITSSTALKLPVKEICQEARKKGLLIIVDGAHSPGHIAINMAELDADFYTGACHKWMLTPKGSSFLWAKKDKQHLLEPLVVSWGYEAAFPGESTFIDHHEFNGTRDFSAYLTLPKAIAFLEKNDWKQQAKRCTETLLQQADRFCELLHTQLLAPKSEAFFGQILSFPIKTANPFQLKEVLYSDFKIEIPIMPHGDQVYLRISCAWYTTEKEFEHLYQSLKQIIEEEKYSGLLVV